MKPIKNLLIIFLIIFFANTLKSQVFQGGVRIGLSGNQVDGDTYGGYNKMGVNAGFWIRLPFNDKLSLQTELYYAQKGSKHNPNPEAGDYTYYLMRLHYAEMPFILRYSPSNKLSLEAGLSFGTLIGSFEDFNDYAIDNGEYKPIEFGFLIGVEYGITDRISLGLRSNQSILSIRKEVLNGSVVRLFDKGQYNNGISLIATYRF